MTRDVTLGFARHVLTAFGGFFVAKGYVDAAAFDAVVGSLLTIAGVVWSAAEKRAR